MKNLLLIAASTCSLASLPAAPSSSYDPLRTTTGFEVEEIVFESGGRSVPCRIYVPDESPVPRPVILFSHGLGGSNRSSSYLGEHWAGRGYVAVFLQHPGSDEDIWLGKDPAEAYLALQEAANAENFALRITDVSTVLNGLKQENGDLTSPLFGRVNTLVVGMSGHSFGAKTTQAVSGENIRFTNPRVPEIRAAIPMSPSPSATIPPSESFGTVPIPWLCMTGTEDSSPAGIGEPTSPADRRKVFAALPASRNMFELVLFGAKHNAFTDTVDSGDDRNPNHHRAILATSTAFWDAYLRKDPAAERWLKRRAKDVLQRRDIWNKK